MLFWSLAVLVEELSLYLVLVGSLLALLEELFFTVRVLLMSLALKVLAVSFMSFDVLPVVLTDLAFMLAISLEERLLVFAVLVLFTSLAVLLEAPLLLAVIVLFTSLAVLEALLLVVVVLFMSLLALVELLLVLLVLFTSPAASEERLK